MLDLTFCAPAPTESNSTRTQSPLVMPVTGAPQPVFAATETDCPLGIALLTFG